MACIREIGTATGAEVLDNSSRLEELDTSLEFLDEKIGTRTVARLGEGQTALSLAIEACRDLEARCAGALDAVGAVLFCTQTPDDGGIPHLSARLHRELDLDRDCGCFDVSLGCSGFVHSLAILSAMMQAQQFSRALLVTSDPYSRIIEPHDRNTVLLFGDAASATLLVNESIPGCFSPGPFSFCTLSAQGEAISNTTGTLRMNGRGVFDFAVRTVPAEIRKLLRDSGVGKDEVDVFLLHQGSQFIVQQLGRALGIPPGRVRLGLDGIGNTVSSSIPILLKDVLGQPGCRTAILCGFGVGLSVATTLLKRNTI